MLKAGCAVLPRKLVLWGRAWWWPHRNGTPVHLCAGVKNPGVPSPSNTPVRGAKSARNTLYFQNVEFWEWFIPKHDWSFSSVWVCHVFHKSVSVHTKCFGGVKPWYVAGDASALWEGAWGQEHVPAPLKTRWKTPPSPALAHQTVLSPVPHLMGCHRRLSTARTGTSCSHGGDGISSLMKVNCAE